MHLLRTAPLLLIAFLMSSPICEAATLTFGTTGSHAAGTTFSVPVYVNAENGEAVNAVASTIIFPNDIVRVVSISDPGLINLWAEKPAFSNAAGTASFQGVIYNPGFSASAGKIVNITFKALAAGTGQIEFKDPSVLANDGSGTEILSESRPSSITITGGSVAAAPRATAVPRPSVPSVSIPATATSSPAPTLLEQPTVAPVAVTPQPQPATRSLLMTLIAALMLPGFVFLLGVIVWLLWPRMVSITHTVGRVLSNDDARLEKEMYIIHYTLTEELKRLAHERRERQLSMSERRIFMRFSALQDHMEKLIGKDKQKSDS